MGDSGIGAVVEDDEDARWMRAALEQARRAADEFDEVPVGAVVVSEAGALLAAAGNRTRTDCDPTAHAEVVALREAARRAGALIQARVRRLVYGARDERAGAVESVFRVCDNDALNHRIELTAGVLEADCRELMQQFFRARRKTEVRGQRSEVSEDSPLSEDSASPTNL